MIRPQKRARPLLGRGTEGTLDLRNLVFEIDEKKLYSVVAVVVEARA
jgi:hypothetical protein